MSASLRDLDQAFQGAGQKVGLEIWRIEGFHPVRVPNSSHGKFYAGDSYIVLKTTALKIGALRHEVHYWLGKDTSQDEAGVAAIKTVELDAALGGRAVQYREIQGHETDKFLSYFKPCIIPLQGKYESAGFMYLDDEEYKPRLFVCRGKHVVHVHEVPFARSTLNHDDIFILDTQSKIFQFNGSNSSIQERAKALDVVWYIKANYHDGKCDIAAIEDGILLADTESGEFWGFFGGFAPLPKKSTNKGDKNAEPAPKLFCAEKGKIKPEGAETLTRDLLNTNKCYVLDCGNEVFVWVGRNTSPDERKDACGAAEELLRNFGRPKSHIIRMIEGFEIVIFQAKFASWPQNSEVAVSEEGRGKVAALLKCQGVNVNGLMKAAPAKDEPQPYIDCTGNLQVWRVNGNKKTLLSASEQSKFYSGDCYIFQYSYPGEAKEEYIIGTWFGKLSIKAERTSATTLASGMIESLKFLPTLARFYEGSEPVQFFAIFQNFIVFKGGLSQGYKRYITVKGIPDDTYTKDGLALFRVQGSGPDNMQCIQVDLEPSSLNSSYCYILHSGTTVYTWNGNLTTSDDQELVERQLDIIMPNSQSKMLKEGAESEQFWELLGEKTEYSSQKLPRKTGNDPHLFSCTFSKGVLEVTELHNFAQDDLMTEDIFILDCHSDVFVWVGQQVDSKLKLQTLSIGEKFVEHDFLREELYPHVPIYIIMEGSEPPFFTRFFAWDSAKSLICGNSFQRKLALLKNGGSPVIHKPKRRPPASYGGRSSVPDKSQRSSRSLSFSPDRVRIRGRSPAFDALAATFENSNARNLSTPPPMVRKPYPKSDQNPDPGKLPLKSTSIASISASFEQAPREPVIHRPRKVKQEFPKEAPTSESNSKDNKAKQEFPKEAPTPESNSKDNSMRRIQEEAKKNETEDKAVQLYPYERLITTSTDPATDVDVTKRETYLSPAEFKEKFSMTRDVFYKLPKWKQSKLKMALQLF